MGRRLMTVFDIPDKEIKNPYIEGKCFYCSQPENALHREDCRWRVATYFTDKVEQINAMADDPIGAILLKMYEVNQSKRADYTGGRGIFANFIESGDQVGLPAGKGIEYMIATKQSRLKGLLRPGVKPNNESVEDTLLDRAVYSVLAVAAYREGLYDAQD